MEFLAIEPDGDMRKVDTGEMPLTPECAFDAAVPKPGTCLQIGERYYLAGGGIEAEFYETDYERWRQIPAWQKQVLALSGAGGPEWLERARKRYKHATKPQRSR